MPFKSEAQRRWMYANHPRMAREWSAHTPKGAKLPEKVKKAYQDGEEEQNKPSFLEDYLKATAAHKLVDSGLSHLVRRNNLFSNYYSNLAREGLNAGLTGIDLAPEYRRGVGALSTSLTGLGDYEAAKAMAQQLKQQITSSTGKEISSLDELINHPLAQKHIQKLNAEQLSPLSRNIVNAMNPNLPASKVVDAIKRHGGMGADNQKASAGIGSALSAAMGYATGGIPGALGAVTANSPDLLGVHMAQQGNMAPLVNLKKHIMAKGTAHGIRGANPAEAAASYGLGVLNPFAHEVYSMGQDVGKPIGANVDKYFNAYENISKPLNFIPGKNKLDEFVGRGKDRIKQNLAGKAEKAFFSPQTQSKIKNWFFRR